MSFCISNATLFARACEGEREREKESACVRAFVCACVCVKLVNLGMSLITLLCCQGLSLSWTAIQHICQKYFKSCRKKETEYRLL